MTQVEALLGGRSSYGYGALSYNNLRFIEIDDTAVILHLSNYAHAPLNECVLELTKGPPPGTRNGPLMLPSNTGESAADDAAYQDVTLGDFRVAVNDFTYKGAGVAIQDQEYSLQHFPARWA
jgi:hypothetical protein